MANPLSSFLTSFQAGNQIADSQRDQRQQNRLSQLASGVIGGNPQAYVEAASINPQAADNLASSGDQLTRRARGAAKYLQSALQGGNPDQIAAARRVIKPFMDTLHPESVYPLDRDPAQELPMIQGFLQQTAYLDGAPAGDQFTLAPGSKRFDAQGRVVAEAPFAPREQEYQWDPTRAVWIPKPAAQASGLGQVINGPNGPFRLDPGINPDDIPAAYADGMSGGAQDTYNLPPRLTAIPVAGVAPKAEPAPEAEKAPSGYRFVAGGGLEPIPGGPADPAAKSQSKGAATEGERKSATLLMRLEGSLQQLNNAVARNPTAATPGVGASIAGSLPFVGDTARNFANSAERQQVENAQLDILDAALTLGTGAAYTKEQLRGYAQSYFPQLGDSPATVRDKADRLNNVVAAARIAAGRAAPDAEGALAPRSPAPQGGGSSIDALLEKYR